MCENDSIRGRDTTDVRAQGKFVRSDSSRLAFEPVESIFGNVPLLVILRNFVLARH